jgi:BirA family biotin operon repressor/biotin-[acetyl-CoA-carboxylase] ligase
MIIEPASWGIPTEAWPRLSLTTAVAVCDAIEAASKELGAARSTPCSPLPAYCHIKWPNDVLIADRKVAGILIESPGGPSPAKDRVVVGVGINVNNSWNAAPRDAGQNGTALCDLTGGLQNIDAVLGAFIDAFDLRLRQLGSEDPELVQTWQQRSWLTGRQIAATREDGSLQGTCQGIAEDGALIIRTPTGVERVYSGSAQLLDDRSAQSSV